MSPDFIRFLHFYLGVNPDMKKPSLINVTAIIMIGIYLYSIISQLSYLSENYDFIVSFPSHFDYSYTIMIITFSVCGIVAGIGLYFYKNWSQFLAIFTATFFLLLSCQSILVIAFTNENYAKSKITTDMIIYLLFATWCLYYLSRTDVDEKLKKLKPDSENKGIKIEDKITKRPRGIKITAILSIIIYGYQIIPFIFMGMPMITGSSYNAATIIFLSFSFFIIPLLGFVSGIGLLGMKNWARKIAVIFSMVAIAFYSQCFFIYNDGFIRFGIVLLLSLPVWSLYYFTQPHIKLSFAQK